MKGSCYKGAGLLAAGFALGVVVASSSTAVAALAKKGWDRFGPMFKQGYVAGFVEAVRIAKGIEPYSYMATQYRVPPKAKALHWMAAIDELYAKKEHENRPMPQLIAIAGVVLESKFGAEPKMNQSVQLEALRTAIEKQRKALLKQKKTVQAAQEEIESERAADAKTVDGAGATGAQDAQGTQGTQGTQDSQGAKDAAKADASDSPAATGGTKGQGKSPKTAGAAAETTPKPSDTDDPR